MKYPPNGDAPSRSSDPSTSHMAGQLVPAALLEKMFLEALEVNPRLTTTEIARIYSMERDSFSPRPEILKRKHLIVQDGYRLVPNKAGNIRKMIAFRLRRDTDTSPDMTPVEQRRMTRRKLQARIDRLTQALEDIATLHLHTFEYREIARKALAAERDR
jgi:hypothetical protein